MKNKVLFAIVVLLIVSLACSFSGNNNSSLSNEEIIATSVAATHESETEAASAETPVDGTPGVAPVDPTIEPDYLLPNSLYYRAESSPDIFQVWRLERDGVTIYQVTNEIVSVGNFTVNTIDGRVAYIVGNQIFLIDADGSNRMMLIDGGPVDESSNVFIYLERIRTVSWSPDGNTLAYGRGGLNFYNFTTSVSTMLIPNETVDYGGGSIGPQALYDPSTWSPDGSKLIVSVGWLEGGTLSIYTPASDTNLVIGYGITCCDYDWSQAGDNIIVGSPVLGLIESGLWRYDAVTGVETVLLPTEAIDGTYNFAGWPKELPNGDLVFFYANVPDSGDFDPPLTMVHTAADGITGLFQVRPETWENYEALWDSSGVMAILVQPAPGPLSWPRTGPIILVDTSGSPIIPLVPVGFDLHWGP